jgi:hypothetical protein
MVCDTSRARINVSVPNLYINRLKKVDVLDNVFVNLSLIIDFIHDIFKVWIQVIPILVQFR